MIMKIIISATLILSLALGGAVGAEYEHASQAQDDMQHDRLLVAAPI
jgi:hypothetical protein